MAIIIDRSVPSFPSKTVTVPNALVEVISLQYLVDRQKDHATLAAEIAVSSYALAGFTISAVFYTGGREALLYSATSDYTTPRGALQYCSGDLNTIAANTSGHFVMDVRGLYKIVIRAMSSSASGSGIVFRGMIE